MTFTYRDMGHNNFLYSVRTGWIAEIRTFCVALCLSRKLGNFRPQKFFVDDCIDENQNRWIFSSVKYYTYLCLGLGNFHNPFTGCLA